MRKLKLDLDDLEVESFVTTPAVAKGGTVLGYATRIACGVETVDFPQSCDGVCTSYYCTDEYSCAYTGCGDCTQVPTNAFYTCPQTCAASCGC
ncbi:MAG: pinensin family lanthipeptide [Longimicrobiaceae bacterium]